MTRAVASLWRLSGDGPGRKFFCTSSDGKVIAASMTVGVQDATTFAKNVATVARVTKAPANLGWVAKLVLTELNVPWTKAQRKKYGIPCSVDHQVPGLKVGSLYYSFLDQDGRDGKTLLPAPALLNPKVVPPYVRLFQNDPRAPFRCADDLLALTWRELKDVLHFCLIDAAVTADDFCMIFSKMADDERFETLPDDYLDAETVADDESVEV